MRSIPEYPYGSSIHPALTSFVDECCATLARLIAYVGALALFGIGALHVWDHIKLDEADEPASTASFVPASRSRPAFTTSQINIPEKSEAYEIFRHPEGGRKDVFHWGPPGERPMAELELYRPGGEFDPSQSIAADIAARIPPGDPQNLEVAGMIDSKFGAVTLLRVQGSRDEAKSCLAFFRRFDDPVLRISGWSCQGTTPAARRAAIGCMLDHLTLLASGNEPKLAELFARAELRRGTCAATPATSTDWVTGLENPRLRGPL
jgi:hypothetical protein